MDIVILIMAEAKMHTATHNPSARYKKYEIVDVFPVGQLQQQQAPFFTVTVTDTEFSSLSHAKQYLLEPVSELRTDPDSGDIEDVILHRRKWMLNLNPYATSLLTDRTIAIAWADLPISERPYA